MNNHLVPVYEDKNIIALAEKQLSIFWLPDEIKVEKDIHDVLTNFSESEKHAVITTLKLFSIYETHVGDEWWSGRFKKMFNRADYHRMASVFSMFELAVHSPFYNKINDLLHLNTPEFYLSYVNDKVLSDRVNHINEIIDSEDDAVAMAGFCMVEGVILYSSFAFLKHFQSNGKNKLMSVVRGINFSVRDEALHAQASAYVFKEMTKGYSQEKLQDIKQKIDVLSDTLLEHEKLIIAKLFEKGNIPGITAHQLENFVMSRINLCYKDLGFKPKYEVKYNVIADTFYKGINDYNMVDFFSGVGREYNRSWSETDFVWKK